jgi:transcriptional regulator
MYLPTQFEETDIAVLHGLLCAYPLATLVTLTGVRLNANHLPLELDPKPGPLGTLRGHVARANPVWRDLPRDLEALAVFQGPQRYITPSWYRSKKETGRVVPTWNYAVVHAYGPLRVIEDPSWLRRLVERLTGHNEASRAQPWKVSDAPEEFIESQLRAIVGIEMPITELSGKWKVSQNRSNADREGVVEGLEGLNDPEAAAMAELVRQQLGK